MNEELKIIIRAVTTEAQKNLDQVKKSLKEMETAGKKSGSTMQTALSQMGKGAAVAIGSIVALTAALVALGKSTMEFRKTQAQLVAGFNNVGLSAGQAAQTYEELFSFLGERDRAVEASNLLAQLTQDEQELAEWTNILTGVYAKFPSSLPVESLAEAANETAKTSKVTGALADALNWVGYSEEVFQAQLDATNSVAEREALIRNTLNTLYSNSANLYKQNNKALIEYNKSQVALDTALAEATRYVMPLMTSLNTLGATLLTYLTPAIHTVSIYLTAFIQLLGEAIEWTATFFGLISGSAVTSSQADMAGYQKAMEEYLAAVQGGLSDSEDGANSYGKSLEKLKKQAMGFDELNIVSNPANSSAGGGSSTPSSPSTIKPPDPADYGLGADALAERQEEFNQKLEDAKKVLKPIMITLGLIASIIGGMKVRTIAKDFAAWFKPFAEGATKMTTGTLLAEKLVGIMSKLQIVLTKIGPFFTKIGTWIASAAKAVAAFVGGLGAGTIIAIVAVIAAIASAVYFLWKNWEGVTQAVKNFFAENVAPKFEKIGQLFADLWEAVKSLGSAFADLGKLIWNALPPGVKDWLAAVWQGIKNVVAAVVEWFKSIDWLKAIGEVIEWLGGLVVGIIGSQIMAAFSTFSRFLQGLVQVITGIVQIISGIIGGFINLIVALFTGDFSKCLDSVKMIWDGIKNVFSGAINILFGWIYEFVKGIIDWFTELWDVLVGHSIVPDMVEAIIDWFFKLPKTLFSMVANFVKTIIDFFKNLGSNAGKIFTDMVANIKKPFTNIASWFKDTFSKAWKGVKDVFNSGGVIFDGIKSGISGVFKTVVNGLITGINAVIAVPFNNINSILNGIRNINIAGITPFSGLWKNNPLAVPQIPKLATGGLVDGATLAMIGERGREAVLPLENNTDWMDMLAERIASRNATPTKIVLKVGERELGYATINSINGITKQTGQLQLAMF